MQKTQNEFYSSVSKYYAEIFPFSAGQLHFVERNTGGLSGKKILDVGCASGELAFQLAKAGAQVTGIDLNEALLKQAKSRAVAPGLHFQKGDMLNLSHDFSKNRFDAVVCFGNTLVHLPGTDEVMTMLKGVHNVLKSGGAFFLQILNYDYILSERILKLPLIETENIRFVRHYVMEEYAHPLIGFQTELHLKKKGKVIFNETPLLALQSQALTRLLNQSGFEMTEMFSGFEQQPFSGRDLPLVVKALKF